MQGILFYITSFFFFAGLAKTLLFYLKLFEEKDYSVKRLLIYVSETVRGRNILTGKVSLLKWVLIFAYSVTIFAANFDQPYHYLVFFVYLALFLNLLRNLYNRQISLPKFSVSTVIILVLTLLVETALFAFSPVDRFLWMVVLDKLLIIFLGLFMLLVSIFFDFGRDVELNRAIKKIARHNKLLSIAVVGSYGRGSTKEFISRILSARYNVLATRQTYSNTLSIAKTINSELTAKKQIFIAEIDDYNKEDIMQICALASPKIVVVCGINEQKLSLFGSIENILSSKLAAVNSLSRDGIALFNGNSQHTRQVYDLATNKKFMYLVADGDDKADIIATNIQENKLVLSFDVLIAGKRYKLSNLKLLGRQNIENLLPAIFIGVYAGIDFSLIRQELNKIRPLAGSMEPKKIESGAIIIDDTHNANINSVLKALSYVRLYRGKRVLVFEPLVELGKNAEAVHRDLGIAIGEACDFLFLTNDNYYKSIVAGIKKSNSSCEFSVAPPVKIIKFVKSRCVKEDVVLFEGREAAHALAGIHAEAVY